MTMEELQESFNRKIAKTKGTPFEGSDTPGGEAPIDSPKEAPELDSRVEASSDEVAEVATDVEDGYCCPKCGSTLFRRSRRRWYERLIRRPKMARCLKCDHRFPYMP